MCGSDEFFHAVDRDTGYCHGCSVNLTQNRGAIAFNPDEMTAYALGIGDCRNRKGLTSGFLKVFAQGFDAVLNKDIEGFCQSICQKVTQFAYLRAGIE